MIKTVLFDLDGTLLPMNQDIFVGAYLKGLTITAVPCGYEPEPFAKAVMAGTVAMVKNDSSKSNEEAFWEKLAGIYGDTIREQTHIFDEFYRTDFQKIRKVCGNTPKAREVIHKVKSMGLRVALATNPLFPVMATESRIRWAGLEPEDFEFFTSFETSHYCKPNLKYYEEVCARLGVTAEECLMVGNDVSDDMVARQLGMQVFLLTDCLINKDDADISEFPHGSFDELMAYILNWERVK